jgi:hypothetical protein
LPKPEVEIVEIDLERSEAVKRIRSKSVDVPLHCCPRFFAVSFNKSVDDGKVFVVGHTFRYAKSKKLGSIFKIHDDGCENGISARLCDPAMQIATRGPLHCLDGILTSFEGKVATAQADKVWN